MQFKLYSYLILVKISLCFLRSFVECNKVDENATYMTTDLAERVTLGLKKKL